MIESPVVSIVMAAYNEEKYIAEAIRSILDQTFSSFEFIIVNDGSTDKTGEIIQSFIDQRIVYIKNEKNLKLISSLNRGLSIAKGKYIARMDADDIALPDRLKKQVDFMESHPSIGLSGARLEVFGSSTGTMNYPLTHEDILLNMLISSSFGNNVVIFRKEILNAHNLYFKEDYIHCEDYKIWTQWIKVTETANLPDILVRYRSHSQSVSVKYNAIQKQVRNRIRKEFLRELFPELKEAEVQSATGKLSVVKAHAFRMIVLQNKKHKVFQQTKLKNTLNQLWYLDSLEEASRSAGALIKFPLIFSLDFKSNLKRWINVLKHYIKQKLKYH